MADHQDSSRTERILDSEFGLRTILFGMNAASETGRRLFRRRLFRMLLKSGITLVEPQLLRDLRHVADYVQQCEADGALDLVDSLIGMPDLPRMVGAADSFFAARAEAVELDSDASVLNLVAELAGGYRVVELTTASQLETEGKLMQHCVGSYFRDVEAGRCRILSLRDPANGPHCTMEVIDGEITQFQGKQNQAPAERYRPQLREFLLGAGLRAKQWMLHDVGLIQAGNSIYYYDDLPDDLLIDGSLSLAMLPLKRLPRRLRVTGDLSLKYCTLPALPDVLEVGEDLILTDSSLRTLPAGIRVGGRLYLEGLQSLVLPDPFETSGDLVINETPVSTLPETLHIGGTLHLQGSPLTRLPEHLYVGGNLNLRDSAVTALPGDITVVGDMDLNGSAIATLPQNLHVGGTLAYSSAPFTHLPAGLSVGGALALQFSQVTTVPVDIEIGDRLDLTGCPVAELPTGLTVGGRLILTGTKLNALPRNLTVGSYIDITNTPIRTLPDDLRAYGVMIDSQQMTIAEARDFLNRPTG